MGHWYFNTAWQTQEISWDVHKLAPLSQLTNNLWNLGVSIDYTELITTLDKL